MESGTVLVDVKEGDIDSEGITDEMDDPTKRLLKYHFGPYFLDLKTVGLQVQFVIGDKPVPNLLMIERHYF